MKSKNIKDEKQQDEGCSSQPLHCQSHFKQMDIQVHTFVKLIYKAIQMPRSNQALA